MAQAQNAQGRIDSTGSSFSPNMKGSIKLSPDQVSDPEVAKQLIANEHHAHGCCNKRYHCDGSKCPNGRVFNPAIGIPLAVATGGLSAAAAGTYRGIRDHKLRKKVQAAYQDEQTRQDNLAAEEAASRDSLTPSNTSLTKDASFAKELEGDASQSSFEMDGTPVADSEKDSFTKKTPGSKMSAMSELDSTPIDAPPQYTAELEGSGVRVEKAAK